jgi:hypothetical protein
MTTLSYVFTVALYILSGLYIYLLLRRIASRYTGRKMKMINTLSLALPSCLAVGGVGLVTFVFLYLPK